MSQEVFEGRFGFHSCDKETYLKLRLLHRAYYEALSLASAWRRWNRKDPGNRVSRKKIRNERNQVIGYEAGEPLPEPRLCNVFCKRIDKFGGQVSILNEAVVADFKNAKTPCERSEVKPLSLSVEQINSLYSQIDGRYPTSRWVGRLAEISS